MTEEKKGMAEDNKLVAERVKSISISLPLYQENCSLVAWRKKFDAYSMLLHLDEEKKQLFPLCFQSSKFDGIWETADGRSTLESLYGKVEKLLLQERRPEDPLMHFIGRKWSSTETIFELIRDLRQRAFFITKSKEAVEELILLQ